MQKPFAPRGYVLMVVVVLGVVLASLATILLYATGRDRAEGRQQQSSVRAVYAAEAAVAVGVEHLRELLEQKVAPTANDLNDVEVKTRTTLGTSMPIADFPVLSVKYYSPVTNSVSDTPVAVNNTLVTITDGPNRGLRAQQTPIQVLATARIDNASASIADAIRVDLIPVFQFAIFFDGDLEAQRPARMSVSGRVHTNGNLYLSNGERVDFLNTVTVAGKVHSHGAASTGLRVGSGTTGTYFRRLSDGAQREIANDLPRNDATQKTYLETTYGIGGGLQDSTTGAEPLSIPLRLSGVTPCASATACGAGRSCVKVRVTDESGVCTDNVTSRPSVCADGSTSAEFAQSLAIELVKRPATDYANSGVAAPYLDAAARDDTNQTSPYTHDYGPRPAAVEDDGTSGSRDPDDIVELVVPRRVPVLRSTTANDDPGAVVDRLYWKAHLRIIDGIWYRGDGTVAFNPEVDAPGVANPDPLTDLDHAIARVLRYSWWWDVRENRVYCERGSNLNCVDDGNEYQRGQQIRATDFDMAAFMALLERADARSRLFPGGVVPDGGVIVYLSETYDSRYEDANSRVARSANVRNFLNFPTMHNHLTTFGTSHPSLAGLTRVDRATASTTVPPPTPHQLGWFPENLWGRSVASINFESLTRPTGNASTCATGTASECRTIAGFYANPPPNGSTNSSTCAVPGGTGYTAARRPTSRPATFASARVPPPCTQAGAQPLGPENAVRLVRAHTMPSQGFTLVTDNRLYVHGDVNVRTNSNVTSGGFATNQDISGRYALIADSLTIQSERFSDRTHQAANGATSANFQAFHRAPAGFPTAVVTARDSDLTDNRVGIGTASMADLGRALPYSNLANTSGQPANVCRAVADEIPFETRINASLLMGDVPACKNAGDNMGNNSGGVNNFPRFVENWTDVPLVLNGSMVGLFRSERGNSRFLSAQVNSGGTVRQGRSGSAYSDMGSTNLCDYRPPDRQWTFDSTLLQSIGNLPPGTPRVVATDRLRWVRR